MENAHSAKGREQGQPTNDLSMNVRPSHSDFIRYREISKAIEGGPTSRFQGGSAGFESRWGYKIKVFPFRVMAEVK